MYDIRAVMEGLACRKAAEKNAERARRQGPQIVESGRKAVQSGSTARMIAADIRFHQFVYELSGNPMIAPAMETHWSYTGRVMGEVLTRDERPRDIWDQHERILDAIGRGDGQAAEELVRSHITQAADFMIARLRGGVTQRAEEEPEAGSTSREAPLAT
jgi:DNA-binding GntR family transcriptional regulator